VGVTGDGSPVIRRISQNSQPRQRDREHRRHGEHDSATATARRLLKRCSRAARYRCSASWAPFEPPVPTLGPLGCR
jgi:hypothetical protein